MTSRIWILAALALALAPLPGGPRLHAQEPVSPPSVSWEPARPMQGTLFTVTVASHAGLAAVAGRFAGEPLHFRRGGDGGWWAPAAVPVDSAGELTLEVQLTGAGGGTTPIERPVPIAPGTYPMERLTVAPQFGEPLSPALARRTADESARALRVARGAHATAPLAGPADFVRPRPSRITSGFGGGRQFNGQVQSRHAGTDFQGAVGDPVLAAAPGMVMLTDAFYLGGNVVYVDHGGGLSSGYLHLSETLVAAGDTVAAGQRIGSVGATGRVTGPHLHWILRYGSVTVDPLSVFGLDAR